MRPSPIESVGLRWSINLGVRAPVTFALCNRSQVDGPKDKLAEDLAPSLLAPLTLVSAETLEALEKLPPVSKMIEKDEEQDAQGDPDVSLLTNLAPLADEATPFPVQNETPAAHEERQVDDELKVTLGFNGVRGAVVYRPEQVNPRLNNGHVVILGSSGSGKTQLLKGMILELSRADVPVLILDFKEDFVDADFRTTIGADFIAAEMDGLPVNPLAAVPDSETGRINLQKKR